MTKEIAGIAIFALIFMSSSGWTARRGSRPSVNPATYNSSSGEFSLSVNPTDPYGRGPADYRFTKNGAAVWTERLPFTLYDALVVDSGHVVGYAYTNGLEGLSEAGYMAGMGDFIVVVLSEKGEIILKEIHPREASRFEDAFPNPVAAGLVMDGFRKRAILRIPNPDLNLHIEKWWIYDPENGKRLQTLEPEKPPSSDNVTFSVVSVKAVPGTPLGLMQWREFNFVTGTRQALFALVDPEGKIIWHSKADYSLLSREKDENEAERFMRQNGAGVDARKAGVFDLLFPVDGLRISFTVVEQAPGKWEVKKIEQLPVKSLASNHPAPSPAFPALSLKRLGTTNLSTGIHRKASPIHDIASFEFDPKGRICALRTGRDAIPTLLFLSQEGEVLKELELPIQQASKVVKYSNPASVGDSRFVVSVSNLAIGSAAQWFLADFHTGTVNRIVNSECPAVDQAAGFPDGRFAALTTRLEKNTMTNGLFFFDASGNVLWKKERSGYGNRPDDLLSPADITAYGAENLAVVDRIRHTIQIFDTKGQFIRIINLREAWGRKPTYPTGLAQDRDGGFLVYDFNALNTLVQLDANGAILAEFKPKLEDGSPFRVVDGVKRSPQGDLWTSDGGALFRLSRDHVVAFSLGQKSQPSHLSKPGYIEVGPDDRVYIADRRTKAIHVFDFSGSVVGLGSPKAEDVKETSEVHHIAISRAGDIYASLDVSDRKYLHFRKDMTREGWAAPIEVDKVSQKLYFQPSSDFSWIAGYRDIFLVQNLSTITKKINRRADGRWLEYPDHAAVAADGSLAVLARTQSGVYSINTYSSSGDAQRTFDLPFSYGATYIGGLAYDGQHVFIRIQNDVLVYESDGKCLGEFTLPGEDKPEWNGPWMAAHGKELWFVDSQGMKLHRYALPQ